MSRARRRVQVAGCAGRVNVASCAPHLVIKPSKLERAGFCQIVGASRRDAAGDRWDPGSAWRPAPAPCKPAPPEPELRAALRALSAGDEVCIDYGAKGNGELLRCHGFVLEPNPADVCVLDLAARGEFEA